VKAPAASDGCLWPSPEQALLLRAALLDGDAALDAFRTWQSECDLAADVGRETLRLLPLAYDNLLRLGCDDPLMGRLKGVYRRTWCENQRLLAKLRIAVVALHEAGIEAVLLKGGALLHGYYRSPGLRPMADLDLAVRRPTLGQARQALEAIGWHSDPLPAPADLDYRHALWFEDADHAELDLHYHFLRDCLHERADDAFWAATEPFDWNGIPVRRLAPTVLLFHTIVHGVRWNIETPVRWIADALAILRSRGDEVDWDRLVAFAAEQRTMHRVALGVGYLARHFGVRVPRDAHSRLTQHRPTLLERIENTVVLSDPRHLQRHPVGAQWAILADYCRSAQSCGPARFIAGYPHYLRYRWGLRGRAAIPGAIARGVLKRLRPRPPDNRGTAPA
jgi:hypothetical protein